MEQSQNPEGLGKKNQAEVQAARSQGKEDSYEHGDVEESQETKVSGDQCGE